VRHADAERAAETIRTDGSARQVLQRRVLTVVIAGQVLGGSGLAAGVTVGALLAQQMLGSDSVAGLPSALFTLGSALTAFLIGRITQRHGRRLGIGLGFTAGGFGAIGVVIAAVTGNIVLLLVALFVYGAGTATKNVRSFWWTRQRSHVKVTSRVQMHGPSSRSSRPTSSASSRFAASS